MPGYGCVRPGTVIDAAESAKNDPRFAKNFAPLGADEAEAKAEKEAEERDPSFRAKVERLKDMKVKIPRGANRETIDRLFAENVGKVELPPIVR